jgi:hypothetical protein
MAGFERALGAGERRGIGDTGADADGDNRDRGEQGNDDDLEVRVPVGATEGMIHRPLPGIHSSPDDGENLLSRRG